MLQVFETVALAWYTHERSGQKGGNNSASAATSSFGAGKSSTFGLSTTSSELLAPGSVFSCYMLHMDAASEFTFAQQALGKIRWQILALWCDLLTQAFTQPTCSSFDALRFFVLTATFTTPSPTLFSLKLLN